jgi:hypothetical protein
LHVKLCIGASHASLKYNKSNEKSLPKQGFVEIVADVQHKQNLQML